MRKWRAHVRFMVICAIYPQTQPEKKNYNKDSNILANHHTNYMIRYNLLKRTINEINFFD